MKRAASGLPQVSSRNRGARSASLIVVCGQFVHRSVGLLLPTPLAHWPQVVWDRAVQRRVIIVVEQSTAGCQDAIGRQDQAGDTGRVDPMIGPRRWTIGSGSWMQVVTSEEWAVSLRSTPRHATYPKTCCVFSTLQTPT